MANTFDRLEVIGYQEDQNQQKVYILSKEQFPVGQSESIECLLMDGASVGNSSSKPLIVNVVR